MYLANFLELKYLQIKAAGKLVIGHWIRPIICYQKQKSQLETDFTVFIQLTMEWELLKVSIGTLLKILEVTRPCVTRNFR